MKLKMFIAILVMAMFSTAIPVAVNAQGTDAMKDGFYVGTTTNEPLPDKYELKYGEKLEKVWVYINNKKTAATDIPGLRRSNIEVVDIQKNGMRGFTITPKANGSVILEYKSDIESRDYKGITKKLEIIVTGCPTEADPDFRASYDTEQGTNGKIFLNGYDIYTAPNNEIFYENYITNQLDTKNILLDLDIYNWGRVDEPGGMNDANKDENVSNYVLPYIKVKDLKGNTIASSNRQDFILERSQINGNSLVNTKIRIKPGVLKPDTRYQLCFAPDLRLYKGGDPINKDVVFNFKTAPFMYATGLTIDKKDMSLDVNQKAKLSANVVPANADDYECTWASSDPRIVKVDQEGNITAIKAGTALIKASNANGKSASCKITVNPVPVKKVQGLTAKGISNNKIKLKWKQMGGVSEYTVYSSTKKTGKYKKVKALKGNSCTISKLKLGKRYYYKVVATKTVNGTKYNSAMSNVVSATPCLEKTVLRIKSNKKKVYLRWQKTSGSEKYQIYKSSKRNGGYYKLRETTRLKYTDKKVKNKKTYYYKARSYKRLGGKRLYSKFTTPIKVKVK
ncbi:Ig-like domain-containing protein [Anaerovorax odorimutans]|uniref:Ig-like domain-containing protein n=1 Tax=Anaerovorax odorimutans TaxID=109327 RepID=A0ABT1RKE6_9FIRM|nr:Ig-like domain-containing protein [Anaerovorax odorimutans]MCQ4635652.1 Ig-like domain-containing protein [Anaerovorax odorimutans]